VLDGLALFVVPRPPSRWSRIPRPQPLLDSAEEPIGNSTLACHGRIDRGSVLGAPLLRPSGPGNRRGSTGLLARSWPAVLGFVSFVPATDAPTHSGGIDSVCGRFCGHRSHPDMPAGIASALALSGSVVFGWAAASATVGHDRRLLKVILKAMAYSTVAWAAILIHR